MQEGMSACRSCGGSKFHNAATGVRDWEFGAPGVFAYRTCDSCGLAQLHPFPTLNDLVDAYPPTYTAFVDEFKERGLLYHLLFRVRSHLFEGRLRPLIPQEAKVLDVGCGNGEFLTRLIPLGAKTLVGVDFHEKAVALARKKGITAHRGVFVEYAGQPGSFDTIFMINYIEHVLDPRAELHHAHLLLKSGGHLVGELPNFAAVERLVMPRYWGGNHVPRHTFQYTPAVLKKLLVDHGFVDVQIRQDFSPAHLVLTLQNWLQRGQRDLRNNPALVHGRMKYFSLLMLFLLPLQAVFWVFGRAGTMTFSAKKP